MGSEVVPAVVNAVVSPHLEFAMHGEVSQTLSSVNIGVPEKPSLHVQVPAPPVASPMQVDWRSMHVVDQAPAVTSK
jgi:hypothetical protein